MYLLLGRLNGVLFFMSEHHAMQDIPQSTLNETTRTEQSAKVDLDLWEFDLTATGGERYFFCNESNEKGEPVT